MHVPPHKDSRNGTNDGRSRIAYKIAELGDYIHACCLVARKPIGVCDIYMGREFFFSFFFFLFGLVIISSRGNWGLQAPCRH